MKLNNRKIIAREFLIFTICALIFGLAFVGTIPYNYVIKSQIDNLETTSQSLSDSIKKIQLDYLQKINNQIAFYESSEKENWFTVGKNYAELWSKLEKARIDGLIKKNWDGLSLYFKNELKDKYGFNNPYDFENFILNNSLTPNEVEKNASAEIIIDERETIESKIRTEKYKLMDFDDRLEFSLICLMIIGVLSFPLRYFFYAIKWSVKTLKQTEQ
ncbi:MAG: hypothetical protein ACU4F9_07180 [Arcticibacter sp.]